MRDRLPRGERSRRREAVVPNVKGSMTEPRPDVGGDGTAMRDGPPRDLGGSCGLGHGEFPNNQRDGRHPWTINDETHQPHQSKPVPISCGSWWAPFHGSWGEEAVDQTEGLGVIDP